MKNSTQNKRSKSEKTLLTALLLSAPGPIFTGISVLTSFSTTQIADFLRRGAELIVIFVSWLIYRKTQRNCDLCEAKKTRLEHLASQSVGAAMCFTGSIMLTISVIRLPTYEPGGNVIMGLVIAILGFITNTFFWYRYRALTRERFNVVIGSQENLYRAKSLVDLVVVTALTTVAIAPSSPITRYVDIFGSIIVASYLLWKGFQTVREKT